MKLSFILSSAFQGLLLEYDHINYIVLTNEQLLNMEVFTYEIVLESEGQILDDTLVHFLGVSIVPRYQTTISRDFTITKYIYPKK